MRTECTTVINFFGQRTLEVYGRYEWVSAAIEGRMEPDDSMWNTHKIGEPLPGVPSQDAWHSLPPGGKVHPTPRELMGYAGYTKEPSGAVLTLRLLAVDTGEPATVMVRAVAFLEPGQGY